MNPRCFGIVSIPNRERCSPILDELIRWLYERSIHVYLDSDTASLLPDQYTPEFSKYSIEVFPDILELIIVLGGDGTLLRVAKHIGEAKIPILGVNLGGLGFLTDINIDNLFPVLEDVLKGRYYIDERMTLQANVVQDSTPVVKSTSALNDVVINSGYQSRLINLATYVDEKWISTFISDGLIVATPTGSTAYSLSAGGPIIHPKLHAILITPICPHILTNRPIVIPDRGEIKIVLEKKERGNEDSCLISADGQVLTLLKPGDSVSIFKGSHIIKLIQPEWNDYYQVLRTKLNWGKRG